MFHPMRTSSTQNGDGRGAGRRRRNQIRCSAEMGSSLSLNSNWHSALVSISDARALLLSFQHFHHTRRGGRDVLSSLSRGTKLKGRISAPAVECLRLSG